ncbi:ADM_collapsed_G0035900.mRNA.1.CDS.1 [Saccharomyces cerevisiae]|nr:ADM_collapsed_G0035900.mRNA.1.CDS.1 [Saccharomyces cerevisiae]
MINTIIETSVSMERLKSFLLSDEIDDSFIERIDPSADERALPAIEMNNITFLWKSKEVLASSQSGDNLRTDEESIIGSSQIALKNIDHFEAKRGDLVCVVGRVGAGKSTFLKAILGQLPCMSGSKDSIPPKLIIRSSSVAYCSQESWIMNASVRENILFGHKFDQNYYDLTVKACQLLPDLKILPDGDETLVGEKGISLSGGQKARLSLARAVYSRADIYLLDDILSAVDAEVSKNIIEYVLIGKTALLKNKTIILTTNTVSILKHSQMIYALENGEIVEQGNYEDVMNRKNNTSKLKKLLEEFDSPIDNGNESDVQTEHRSESEVDEPLQLKVTESETEDEIVTESELELIKANSRRASLATLRPRPFVGAQLDSVKKTAQEAEKTEVGRVKTKVYLAYIKACGVLGVVLFFLFMILTRVFDLAENFWLKYWSESNEKNGSNERVWMFVGVYSLIGVASAAFNNLRSIMMLLYCSIRGSKKLHESMAKSVIRSPMTFFETTPVGRIINRFSSDMDAVDSNLQYIFSFFFKSILTYLVTVILVGYNMPWFLVFNMFLVVIYIYYQTFYIVLSRELKRLISISYSPIMSLMSESLNGYSIIDAYDHFERFIYLNYEKIQYNVDFVFNFRSTNRWLSVRLQTIGATIVLATAILALATMNTKRQLSSGMVGLLMSYSLEVTGSLTWIVRTTVTIETNIVSVERIVEYCELPPEAQSINPEKRPDENWPSKGGIEFKNYSTKYRENLDPVLNNINVKIEPCEKVGIVGRTGAGKSTLSLALFRILEATEGKIIIDGIDISDIGLFDLRSHLAIIPQDAQAFEGTVKTNLDPFNRYSEDELKRAVEQAHLKPHLEKMLHSKPRGDDSNEEDGNVNDILDVKINENGSNLSVGQRQLLCLARALLNRSKILVLDEATASVDMETDKIIQDTIRREFKDRTILTIAHRIDTVLDSDKIIVLDQGSVREFDSPSKLLSDKTSIFYSLCEKGGYLK